MYCFDEVVLVRELDTFSSQNVVAFAAASATRQLSSIERFFRRIGNDDYLKVSGIADNLWSEIRTGVRKSAEWKVSLDYVMSLLPEEDDDDWKLDSALAQDALASLAYSIRCLLNSQAQEAAWSARRAYEATDQAAIALSKIDSGSLAAEFALLSHKFVQRELKRQKDDLDLLRCNLLDEVEKRAFTNQLLTDDEVGIL